LATITDPWKSIRNYLKDLARAIRNYLKDLAMFLAPSIRSSHTTSQPHGPQRARSRDWTDRSGIPKPG